MFSNVMLVTEVGHGGSIYPIEIGEYFRSEVDKLFRRSSSSKILQILWAACGLCCVFFF